MPRSAANDAGIKVGDLLVTVDGDPLVSFVQLVGKVEGSGGNPLALEIWRDGHIAPVTLAPRMTDEPNAEGGFDKVYRIGIAGGQFFFEPASIVPPLGEAFSTGYVTERVWGGVQQTWMTAKTGLSALWHLAAGNISRCNLSGPIGIADASGTMASQGVVTFILFVAALSTAIGFLNLLPIPVLDGGHLLFYAYEAVVGRPPSDRVLQVAMSFGLAVVLGVMIFGLANDFTC
jgi:regulator of sigma E protease